MVLAWRLPLTYFTLGCMEIPVHPEIRVYFYPEYVPNSGPENFAMAR